VITKKLCLVLGAGASSPYGFPTGADLLTFANNPNDDWWPIAEKLFRVTRESHQEFVRERTSSGAASLDEFVGRQMRYKDYAKALIAFRIGQCESLSAIRGVTGSQSDWMTFFIRQLVDGVQLKELGKTELSVVTFNFDRCFEETLLLRLSSIFRAPGETDPQARVRVASELWRWPIVHVHGSLGPLIELARDGRPYEPTLDPQQVLLAAQRLVLLDDAQEDSQEFQAARELIRDASLVLFLGFGFHRLNCKRVLPRPWGSNQPTIYGTVQDMSVGRIEKAKQYLLPLRSLHLLDLDNLQLLKSIEHVFSD
jgi:hypothetical protein